jgi:hypothetical protein
MYAAGIEGWHTPRAFSYHVVPPYRLGEDYLRWKAQRNGGHIARRNRQEWGRVMFVLNLLARTGQAVFGHIPRLLAARLRGDRVWVQEMRCRLWHSEGYVRHALFYLAPRLFPQRAFFARMDFRSERALFASPQPAPAPAAPLVAGSPGG